MSPAPDLKDCERLDRWLNAYVDDELDAVHTLEVEEHVEACGDCAELLATLRATRNSLREVCQDKAPSALRERLQRSLMAERFVAEIGPGSSLDGSAKNAEDEAPVSERASSTAPPPRQIPTLVKLRYVMPLAAAATIALVFGAMQLQEQKTGPTAMASGSVQPPMAQVASLDALIDDMVEQHAHPLPPETTDPEELARFDSHLGVNVRRAKFDNPKMHWVGARMVHRRAAMMQYRVRDNRRITVYVFDPRRVPIRADRLSSRRVGPQKVYVGKVRGYTVAASQSDGIGYALASDLTPDESAQLMVAAR